MSRKAWIRMGSAALIVPSVLLMAACSSSGSASSKTSSAAASSGGASSSSSTSGTITIGFIGSLQSATYNFPETAAAAQARVDAVNDAGGINGKKVKLSVCNDNTDANQASVCVRQMTTDGVVGVIGGISTVGSNITSGLETAHLIYTGMRALSPGELNSTISFPMVGGSSSTAAGEGTYAATTAGCQRPYELVSDSAPSRLTATAFAAGYAFAANGKTVGQTITPSPNTDYSAAVSSAVAAKADCVFISVDVAEGPKVIPAVKTALPNAKMFNTAGAMPPTIIKALGAAANGFYLSDSVLPLTTTGNSTLTQFQAEMAKYQAKSPVDGFALTSWLGTQLLLNTISKMTAAVTAQSVLDAFNQLGQIAGNGVIGDFSFKSTSPVPTAKRQFNRTYIISQIDSTGALQAQGGFADASAALATCTKCG